MRAAIWAWLFWCSTALIAYTYALYPAWLWLRAKLAPHPWQRAPITPSVSIIIAVHNGAALIGQQIARLLELDYPAEQVEIIIVSDGSTDGTAELLRAFEHPRVRPLICEEHAGKAVALNVGVAAARNELLVFVDARPRLERGALRQLVSNFADPQVGCAGGELALLPQTDGDASSAAVGGFYWRLEQAMRVWESQIDSPCGVAGALYAVRRDLAVEFPAGLLLDDMFQPLSVVRKGYRVVIDGNARVFDHVPNARGEFRRKARTLAGNFQLLKLAPWLWGSSMRLRSQLLSHKFLRLAAPVFLSAILVASLELQNQLIFFRVMVLLQAGFYLVAALGLMWGDNPLRKLTGVAAGFVLLNAAVVVGVYRFCTVRPLWKTWKRIPGRAVRNSEAGASVELGAESAKSRVN